MARGSVVKRQSGNYAIVYYVDGKQKWETIGPSRREAERALTARKREVDTGSWREPSSETLSSYAERWLAHRDPARVTGGRTASRARHSRSYRRALRLHVLPRLGQRTLASLRTEDVDASSPSSSPKARRLARCATSSSRCARCWRTLFAGADRR